MQLHIASNGGRDFFDGDGRGVDVLNILGFEKGFGPGDLRAVSTLNRDSAFSALH